MISKTTSSSKHTRNIILIAVLGCFVLFGYAVFSGVFGDDEETVQTLPKTPKAQGIYSVLPLSPMVEEELFKQPLPTLPKVRPKAPTVVLVVMDTVRADRTSLCGHTRPTTPFLVALTQRGASHTCYAYTPGDWSWPTHASYFTGLPVTAHGAHYATTSTAKTERTSGLQVHSMRDVPTLAEEFQAQGYQTVLVSDNALLTQNGLNRGFEIKPRRPKGLDPRVDWVPTMLQHVLAKQVDPNKPLFLVLNFTQAHDPWVGVPSDLKWEGLLEPQLEPDVFKKAFFPALHKKLGPAFQEQVRRQLEDVYDYGIYREDRNLKRSVSLLEDVGWLSSGFRVAITADHGELLFEHQMWRHSFIYEPNTRVPFVYWSDQSAQTLPKPFPALAIHELLKTGKLPEPLPRPHTVSIPNPDMKGDKPQHKPAVALWVDDEKLVWMKGAYYRFDVRNDPSESDPKPLPADHPVRAELEALVASVLETIKPRTDAKVDEQLMDQLRDLGYVE